MVHPLPSLTVKTHTHTHTGCCSMMQAAHAVLDLCGLVRAPQPLCAFFFLYLPVMKHFISSLPVIEVDHWLCISHSPWSDLFSLVLRVPTSPLEFDEPLAALEAQLLLLFKFPCSEFQETLRAYVYPHETHTHTHT